MKEIEIYLWWSCGRLDGDGYETDYKVSQEEYDTIIGLLNRCAKEGKEEGEEFVDEQDFTKNYLYENARHIYDKMKSQLYAKLKASVNEWFDQEAEGCTLEEYIDNTYNWGFYLSEEFVDDIVGPIFEEDEEDEDFD